MTMDHEAFPPLDDLDLLTQSIFVLIVDGDIEQRESVQTSLARRGIGSDCYGNEERAMDMIRLHHARRQEYDLILVNHTLPKMNGVELIGEIRSLLGENPTVIFLTGDNAAEGDAEAKKAGADAFLAKPLSSEAILQEYQQAAHRRKAAHEAASAPADLEGRRVLVAEDMTVNAEILKQVLSINFMEADHVKNGQEALDKFTESPAGYYDAILMDVRMPVMDGLAATKAIRASDHPDAKSVPIIALTSNYFDEDVQRSLEVGMDAHLEKPAEPEQIYKTLAELIGKRK